MDDAIAKGLVMGLVLGILGLIADLVWKLIRSRSEGSRRFKIVAGVGLLLLVGSILVSAMGPLGAIGTSIAIAAIVWVIRGFKTGKSATEQSIQSKAFTSKGTTVDAAEFAGVVRAEPERKTIISCPNCDGKLRVVAGKYIDVTCPHCQTLFRTHT